MVLYAPESSNFWERLLKWLPESFYFDDSMNKKTNKTTFP